MRSDISNHEKIMAQMSAKLIAKRKSVFQNTLGNAVLGDRMKEVRVLNDIIFIDDAKAENVNACYYALKSIRKPIVWITGGADEQTNYWDLMSLVRQKVEAIIMIGADNDKLYQTFSPVITNIYQANNMSEAVQMAYEISEPYTSVLLSPAAKADIKFADAEDRSKQFVQSVMKL